jgi:hypothetical protein
MKFSLDSRDTHGSTVKTGPNIMKKHAEERNWTPRHNGNPVVKSGPKPGYARIETRSGKWRKKRSDAGKSRKPY